VTLRRLVVTFKPGQFVLHTHYRTTTAHPELEGPPRKLNRSRTVGFVESRSRHPEERGRVGRFESGLPPHGPGRTAVIKEERPEESFDRDPDDHCGRCERPIWCVIRDVYEDDGGGGGR
jgi:hypothetical protein